MIYSNPNTIVSNSDDNDENGSSTVPFNIIILLPKREMLMRVDSYSVLTRPKIVTTATTSTTTTATTNTTTTSTN